ncbi:three-Cys-motif partner protein TcmP [Rhizobium sp. NFR12]|uniref:three-Cys-motif partner protein TcmP n=1 Tax=Rhizobium sp. NFR12 TaxID=1566261 RepID=UPI0008A7B135|nr:three-Cys-motif partner protein TcmP [Rhizobium sp. NFR12]SEH22514.1 three-Cys-motif partner protein [Rhizobium sp. NFR12]
MTNDSLFQDLPHQMAPVSIMQAGVDPVWTEHKAKLIARYLRYFVFITKHGCYVDGFAGPKNKDLADSWAAELVVNSEPRFLKQFFLCDQDPGQVSALQSLVSSQPSAPKRTFQVLPGDFNATVDQVLDSGVIGEKTATFCLLDQYSCECHWETVRKLARHKGDGANKIEQFYFLATGWLGRSLAGFKSGNPVPDNWWGSSDWLELQGLSGDLIAIKMAERFRDELGYRFVRPWPIYKREKGKGRIMFHMIHASDHPEAHKLMKRAYKHVLDVPESEEQLNLELAGQLTK